MTRQEGLVDNGTSNPVAICDVCGTVARLNTMSRMGLWVCSPCESEYFTHLIQGVTR